MSKKRGLSLEEKREKILEVFHESKDVFQLKDIEKLATKKGVISQSVKEVLQSLVDDDMVHQDKIGISNFFWSFPSESAVKLDTQLQKAQSQAEQNSREQLNLQRKVQESTAGKENSADRQAKLQEVKACEQELRDCQAQLEQHADNDPDRFKGMQEALLVSKDSANRWLGNLECLTEWCKRKFEGKGPELDGFFKENGFTDEMEEFQ